MGPTHNVGVHALRKVILNQKPKKRLFHWRNSGGDNNTLVSRSGKGPIGCQDIGCCVSITSEVSELVITERFSCSAVIILIGKIGISLKNKIVGKGRIVRMALDGQNRRVFVISVER
jgi:hypothetical protein